MKKPGIAILTLIGVSLTASPAYAYLDPGTGSMLLQALIGAAAGAFVVAGVYWTKFKSLFSRWRKVKGEDPNDRAG